MWRTCEDALGIISGIWYFISESPLRSIEDTGTVHAQVCLHFIFTPKPTFTDAQMLLCGGKTVCLAQMGGSGLVSVLTTLLGESIRRIDSRARTRICQLHAKTNLSLIKHKRVPRVGLEMCNLILGLNWQNLTFYFIYWIIFFIRCHALSEFSLPKPLDSALHSISE